MNTRGWMPSARQLCTWPWIDCGVTADSHSAGCGRVTGRGSTVTSGNCQNSPAYVQSWSFRQPSTITSRCSRKWARLVGMSISRWNRRASKPDDPRPTAVSNRPG